MNRLLPILLFSTVAFATSAQNDKVGLEQYDSLVEVFTTLDFQSESVTIPDDNGLFQKRLNAVLNWTIASGDVEKEAYCLFMRFNHLYVSENENLYDLLVAANGLWRFRNHLPKDELLDVLPWLNTIYQVAKMPQQRLEVILQQCELEMAKNENHCFELGGVYHDLEQYEQAIEFYELDVKQYLKLGNRFMAAAVTNNIGGVYKQTGNNSEAKKVFEKTMKMLEDTTQMLHVITPSYIEYFKNIVRWNLLDFSGTDQVDDEKVEIARKLIRGGRQERESYWPVVGYRHLGWANYGNSEFSMALLYLDSAHRFAIKFGQLEMAGDILQLKARVKLSQGFRERADELFNRSESFLDSLERAESELEASIAAAEYQAYEKEEELETSKRNTAEERRAKQWTSALLGVASLLILLVLILLRKSRKDRLLINDQKQLLEGSLGEKEVLLKEIHHRVKNNLQIVSNILDLGTFTETDPKLLAVLEEARDRIKSMALIHKNLYQHDDLSGIKVNPYFNDLIKAISGTYVSRNRNIETKIEAEDILLDIDTAVPIGLIVNELVSNAFKYAFPDNAEGEIVISLKESDDLIHLSVTDNGVGIPADLDMEKLSSLGLRIVRILTNQLEGDLSIVRNGGTEFRFTFKPLKQRKQED